MKHYVFIQISNCERFSKACGALKNITDNILFMEYVCGGGLFACLAHTIQCSDSIHDPLSRANRKAEMNMKCFIT